MIFLAVAKRGREVQVVSEAVAARQAIDLAEGFAFSVARYRRVSTDDKGQDPRRQFIATDAWAERERVRVLLDVGDEGTSATFTNPFERPAFVRLCEEASAAGCRGILAESPDRVCGGGADELGWTRFELRRRYRLELFFADVPLALHGTVGGNVVSTTSADVRRDRVALDRKRMKEGIDLRRETCECDHMREAHAEGGACARCSCKAFRGKPVGGAASRFKLDEETVDMIREVALEHPTWGSRRIAGEVSARRGANVPSLSAKEARRRKITHETVRKALDSPFGPSPGPAGDAEPSGRSDRQIEAEARPEGGRQDGASLLDRGEP